MRPFARLSRRSAANNALRANVLDAIRADGDEGVLRNVTLGQHRAPSVEQCRKRSNYPCFRLSLFGKQGGVLAGEHGIFNLRCYRFFLAENTEKNRVAVW
ncbi:MAG: hypothetical protein ACI9W2_002168, partial [Gammaproteobacteria bacterium]